MAVEGRITVAEMHSKLHSPDCQVLERCVARGGALPTRYDGGMTTVG
jgi:hypothetical protein